MPRRKDAPRVDTLGRVDRYSVFLVNGTLIRDLWEIDFTMGGGPARYPDLIPKGELWIDRDLALPDQRSTILHEAVETRLMLDRGFSYDRGHQQANVFERAFRKAQDRPPVEQAVAEALRVLKL